jgi:hypothetical protein
MFPIPIRLIRGLEEILTGKIWNSRSGLIKVTDTRAYDKRIRHAECESLSCQKKFDRLNRCSN